MSDLSKIVQCYLRFERKVQSAVSEFCQPYCTACKGVCCSADYCRETVESPFLSLLHQASPPRVRYSETDGWMTPSGCALTAGRAPVCYEFLCDRIIGEVDNPKDLYVHKVLSHLVTHAGRFAPGRRHVVELMRMEELEALELSRFRKRLKECETAFSVIRLFQKKKPLPGIAAAALSLILKVDKKLQMPLPYRS